MVSATYVPSLDDLKQQTTKATLVEFIHTWPDGPKITLSLCVPTYHVHINYVTYIVAM